MNDSKGFYTFNGYQKNSEAELTSSMEDYLEMIFRLHLTCDEVRIAEISKMLHVQPSSTTKMVQALNNLGYLDSKKYGYIFLTQKGEEKGKYLLYRHDVLNKFLCVVNRSKTELEQTEKIEHFLNEKTIRNLDLLTKKLRNRVL